MTSYKPVRPLIPAKAAGNRIQRASTAKKILVARRLNRAARSAFPADDGQRFCNVFAIVNTANDCANATLEREQHFPLKAVAFQPAG
ncbi:hypothetical protein [Caballeronia sp. Lep1P3]|uniref:hypothetical protein n=1 Tax=Caballeronia sp. Lep1P3 TaxID=2878150 RepID=UPI001FD45098|nr:hypothetical protein [Caballeronia sp. Lep1P3]